MVDTQPDTGNNSYPAGRPVHLVIDHHASKNDLSQVCWVDVREHYGASATILYEYLCAQEVSINIRLATSLFYAIKSETQDLGREWSRADREAYLQLLPLSNNRILFDIVHPQVPREYFSAFRTAIENSRVYGKLLVFNLRQLDNPDMVAELADFMLRQEGVRYVLGMGWYAGMQIISMRSNEPDAHLGIVIQQLVKGIGTAGGHGMVAGGQIRSIPADASSQQELERLLTRRLFKALNLDSGPGEPLLPSKNYCG
jgi:nanoRNase/pAp phosphatase (c-di-AMP/oligoRNAs hydrolase)